MKTKFLKTLFVLLISLPFGEGWGGVLLSAQNGVTVSGLAIDAGTVTFNVSWDRDAMPVTLWSDSVWVFVDYNNVGKMERLPVTGATASAGTVIMAPNNNKGVWVIGNARTNGNFSATVQLLTATATATGACVYGSNYPPVGEYISTTEISFTGTPPYDIVLKHENGGTVTVQSGSTFLLPCDYILTSFTDATTGAPGIMKCVPPATYTLSVSALSFCAGSEGVQFSLSGTEAERNYQLFRNNSEVGAVLNGTGNAATFTGSFNVAGTYTTRTVADDLYCETAMDGTRAVIENLLPDIPGAPNVSRQCPGTVTLSASSSSGAVIDWYANAIIMSPFHTGASYTTPEIETSTTYYVQARIAETGCLSARMPVAAEVNMEGCCDTPGATGVTFAKFNPCAGASYGATYTLTDDRDQKTYKVTYMPNGSYWMAQILAFGNCTTSALKNDNSAAAVAATPTVAEGYVGHCRTNTNGYYYYSWSAAMNNVNAFSGSTATSCSGTNASANACRGICPTGWHLPTRDEYTLILTYKPHSSGLWTYVGTGWYNPGDNSVSGSATETWSSTTGGHASIGASDGYGWYNNGTTFGMVVRCVKNY
jgi:uncharacterized protein (TIGR02145 family)